MHVCVERETDVERINTRADLEAASGEPGDALMLRLVVVTSMFIV